jgi:4-hydroxythreonine-4-phosphate dehydrogenase
VRLAPLAVTLGDPAGIGPEIICKAWDALKDTGPAFVVVGDLESLASAPGSDQRPLKRVGAPHAALSSFSASLPVIDAPLRSPVVAGHPSAASAKQVISWIETAVGLALSHEACGVVTGPIAKKPLYQAGFAFPGHTEFLASLTAGAPGSSGGPVMMLAAPGLRTVPATIHMPLSQVPAALSSEMLVKVGRVVNAALKADFGIEYPRIAMTGLNPHAGEGGTLGDEEARIIVPAIQALKDAKIDVRGPLAADTLFHAEARKRYDAAICMYHDQALVPVKMLDFWGGVNITLGLPIVRTSPDHGVAFDIAGRGLANPASMIAAIRMAADVAERRARA